MRAGRFDLQRLWRLPDGAETFSGDGRFTAGHVALLERLHREDALYGVLPFDRLDPDPVTEAAERDEEMARRLLAGWDRALPLLAVVGAAHAPQLGAALGVEPAPRSTTAGRSRCPRQRSASRCRCARPRSFRGARIARDAPPS